MCVAPMSGSSYSEQMGTIPAKPVGERSISHLLSGEVKKLEAGVVTQLGSAESGVRLLLGPEFPPFLSLL